MINYRQLNYRQDIEEVVSLINKNLNPSQTSKFLKWKHLNNPFGTAKGAVATINDKIVAVGFYMPYNFMDSKNQIIKSLRAVDVCTSKAHRGQGIYKNLMKFCLNLFGEDYDILIGAPNKNSYPAAIKDGWKNLKDNNYFRLGLVSPFAKIKKLSNRNKYHNFFVTGQVEGYLKWRYSFDEYLIAESSINQKKNYLIYRIKHQKIFKYIVLCDFIGDQNQINNAIIQVCKKEKIYFIYYLANKINNRINFIFTKTLKKTKIIYKENNFELNNNIVLSLADIERKI